MPSGWSHTMLRDCALPPSRPPGRSPRWHCRPADSCNQFHFHRIASDRKENRDRGGRGLGSKRGRDSGREQHRHVPADQLSRHGRQSLVLTLIVPAVFERDVLAVDIAGFLESPMESVEANDRQRRLLRASSDRPSKSCAAEQGDEGYGSIPVRSPR